jgi:hypothetical protein
MWRVEGLSIIDAIKEVKSLKEVTGTVLAVIK